MKEYKIPYSTENIPILLPEEQVDFTGELQKTEENLSWKKELLEKLEHPTAGAALSSLLEENQHIVILVEDNTRHTPVRDILPILCDYLTKYGCGLEQLEILVAPGTHRILTEEELWDKLGSFVMTHLKVSQHDYRDETVLEQLEDVYIGEMKIPVYVNHIAVSADLLIGLGNIIPHPNAGYSGGAKILDPGCCGRTTVSATHTAAALMGYLPLGMEENACRDSLERVAKAVGLDFIINVVLNEKNQVVDVVTGDFILAHRAGAKRAKEVFGVAVENPVDILISCSYPYDIDFWQCEKALIAGFFAVKQGGIIILPAPCLEGVVHNHDDLLEWTQMSSKEAKKKIRLLANQETDQDLVAAGIALGALMVRDKADIYIYSTGLTQEEIGKLGYTGFSSLQEAVDASLAARPGGRIGILPRGGDCLPYLV
ncbi:nickel-dependent lactate racemase [[Clostridium] symbiosum]|uniref:nickel-dependent lactate racemase n=1 Tax=Clostridium symbiosum TaxID=1512 RepID=UPI001D060B4C|nr:nickel-dependent lactate racemase [[Clostridium] symbiosum]MCB6610715.1 nickel-dependent lactate racemase [[Clostridium] symbiosum]MCB6930263.1 nickel-dependent lactate racemase [[Clostridium] symbiosum]